jgi:CubicO group peptidase (beta-lactamase class C family)
MIRFNSARNTQIAWIAALSLFICVPAGATDASPAEIRKSVASKATQTVMQRNALQFWRTVAAKPDQRASLLKRYFSADIVKRNGAESLLEMLASLAEMLGPDLMSLAPEQVLGSDREGELHYRLADGRGIMLMLTLSKTEPPQIDRFGVRPLAQVVAAVPPEQLSKAISERINAEFKAQRFSGAVLVARGDTVIHAQAVGLANRARGRANTLDTPINLGSINKMFTAIAIAQLQEAGKLDWQDKVGKYLPEFPNVQIRDQVTIHQLLTHTSGVGSYWNDAYSANKNHIDTQQEFLDTFVAQPLLFQPGKGLEYSNGGPVILGLIIEAITGEDYYDYIRKHIYRPAGMTHADHYRRDDQKAGFALGYIKPQKDQSQESQWQDNQGDLGLRGSAAGGGYASARDLLAFSRALNAGQLLPRSQLETLWKPYTQQGPIGYGYLFSVGNTAGQRWVGHDGGAPGISAEFIHYPEDGLTIIVLANQDNAAAAMREWLHALLEASQFEKR